MESDNLNSDIDIYIKSLSPKDFKAFQIAKSHLGTTFDIEKSIGFLKWLSQNIEIK